MDIRLRNCDIHVCLCFFIMSFTTQQNTRGVHGSGLKILDQQMCAPVLSQKFGYLFFGSDWPDISNFQSNQYPFFLQCGTFRELFQRSIRIQSENPIFKSDIRPENPNGFKPDQTFLNTPTNYHHPYLIMSFSLASAKLVNPIILSKS